MSLMNDLYNESKVKVTKTKNRVITTRQLSPQEIEQEKERRRTLGFNNLSRPRSGKYLKYPYV